jgi:hypothetical protein
VHACQYPHSRTLTFPISRNVVGINNRSLGPLADLAQCLIQRDLRW